MRVSILGSFVLFMLLFGVALAAPLSFDDASAVYSGRWHVIPCPACSGGSFHATKTPGDWFKVTTPSGVSSVTFHYLPGSTGAIVRVKVDGVGRPKVTLDNSGVLTVAVPADGQTHKVKVIFKGSACTDLVCPKLTLDSWAAE